MNNTLGECAPSNTAVYNWIAEFKYDRTSTSDGQRSGRTETVTSPKMIEKTHISCP